MPSQLQAPVHDPRNHAMVPQLLSLQALQSAYADCIRNLAHSQIERIERGQLSQRELAASERLQRAVIFWGEISQRQLQFSSIRL